MRAGARQGSASELSERMMQPLGGHDVVGRLSTAVITNDGARAGLPHEVVHQRSLAFVSEAKTRNHDGVAHGGPPYTVSEADGSPRVLALGKVPCPNLGEGS